jgi:lysophospholipase L1-like esterase
MQHLLRRSLFALLRAAVLCPLLAGGLARGATPAAPTDSHWVGVWAAPPAPPTGPDLQMEAIRQTVRLSLGGQALRIRLSNELGSNPVVISTVHVALPGQSPGSIDPATDHALTFGGRDSLVMQPGMPMLSDPLALKTESLQDIVVSLFVTRSTGPTATHPLGMATTFMSDSGGESSVAAPALNQPTTSAARLFLSEVEVLRPGAQTVVALGDSITDGYGSTADQNHRWPDYLAERLAKEHRPIALVNAGISGNRLLHDLPNAEYGPSALSRLDRDVLSVPGAKTLILLESINDIGISGSNVLPEQTVSVDDIIAGMSQIIARAHAHGIRVIGATLTPFAGTVYPGYYSAEGEAKRQAVNRWVREGHAFDAVVDFDGAVRDPSHPDQLTAAFDCGDHLHPNDAGYRKMADSVNLDLLAETQR